MLHKSTRVQLTCQYCNERYSIPGWVHRSHPDRKYCSRICHGLAKRAPNGAAGWAQTRRMIWERDGGICQVCLLPVPFDAYYHCGHIVDRRIGGPDSPDNLVVMCHRCNVSKPVHQTREDYEAWRDGFGSTVTIYEFVHVEEPSPCE